MKRVADAELEAGTLERAELGFREQTAAMSEPDQPVETPFQSRVVPESENVEGRAATHVQVPHRERARETGGGRQQAVCEFEVQRDQREVVSHARLDIRPKSQALGQLTGLEMHSGVELIRVGARSGAYSQALGSSGSGEHSERNRCDDRPPSALHRQTPASPLLMAPDREQRSRRADIHHALRQRRRGHERLTSQVRLTAGLVIRQREAATSARADLTAEIAES